MRLLLIALLLAGCDTAPTSSQSPQSAGPSATAADRSALEGIFIGWDPVDDARGYAIVTIHNNGLDELTAECTVTVTSDFGDTGTGTMEPATLLPEESVHVSVAINVGSGSAAIDDAEIVC